jgi:release factor glutamine methyltransferase
MAAETDRWDGRLDAARARLEERGIDEADSRLRWLAAHLLSCGLLDVGRHREEPLAPDLARAWEDGVVRLAAGEPVQYVIGETDFLGLRIRCDRRALIPRPETEELALCAEDDLRARPGRPVAVDAGTGTGCIACALALRAPRARIIATDLSADALGLARENAEALGARVDFIRTDLLAGLPDASADLVVSNPPYVSSGDCDRLPAHVRAHDPRLALDGGPDGLRVISRLVSEAARVIVPSGRLMMEIGDDQAEAVREILCPENLFNLEALKCDCAGRVRLAVARRVPAWLRAPTCPGAGRGPTAI